MRILVPLLLSLLGALALGCSKPAAPATGTAPVVSPRADAPAAARQLTLTYFTMPG